MPPQRRREEEEGVVFLFVNPALGADADVADEALAKEDDIF
jgi:hypothetical protein